MHLRYLTLALACALGSELSHAQSATAASALSEQDFLADVPIVLSVSRLAQRLDETPGAMTILDRDFIRMTGARDVADLLRFVPGFHTTNSFETDAPMAYYHGRNDDWANRLQVLVDGRSVYSSHLQGSAGVGLQTLALDEIERIEVLRGSNSAAYGARAFLGVVNIVSRDVRDTKGARVGVRGGENGVADLGASFGAEQGSGAYRLSVDTRGDDGLRKVFLLPDKNWAQGGNRVSRANLSVRLALDTQNELILRSGMHEVAAYRGTVGEVGNQERMRFMTMQYAQADWVSTLSSDEDVRVSVSRTQMRNRDGFSYLSPGPFDGITVSFSGDEVNDAFSAQHTLRLSSNTRLVWGGELRQEQVTSMDSFDTASPMVTSFSRLFAHAEVRLAPTVLLNAGALLEQSNLSGSNAAPRVMLNWNLLEGQTLRAGMTSAFRPPSQYEKYAQVVYHSPVGASPIQTVYPNPDLKSEWVVSRELGYRWDSAQRHWAVDLRMFEEQLTDGIGPSNGQFANNDATVNRVYELQAEWRPSPKQRLFVTYGQTDTTVLAAADTLRAEYATPKRTASLAWMQSFAQGWSTSVMHTTVQNVGLMSPTALSGPTSSFFNTDSVTRTDLRVAREFMWDRHATELSLVVQNLNAPYRDGDRKFFFDRRAFMSLVIGF